MLGPLLIYVLIMVLLCQGIRGRALERMHDYLSESSMGRFMLAGPFRSCKFHVRFYKCVCWLALIGLNIIYAVLTVNVISM